MVMRGDRVLVADSRKVQFYVLRSARLTPPVLPLDPQIGWTVRVTRDGKPMPDAGVTVEGKSWITAGKLDTNDILAEHPTCSRTHCMFIVDQVSGLERVLF
jgi:hypothetical protein